MAIDIVPVATAAEIVAVRELFVEYQRELGIDLGFQGFEDELARLLGTTPLRAAGSSSRARARRSSAASASGPWTKPAAR